MSEVVERVARALCAADGYVWDDLNDPMRNPNGGDAGEAYYLGHARAAIEAMREPTRAMLDRSGEFSNARATRRWEDMIDAALKD